MMHHAQIAQRAFNTPLMVDPAKALAFLSGLGPRITGQEITSGTYPNIPKNGDVTLTIKAENFSLPTTGAYVMTFQYIPRAEQSELSISWKQKGENL